MPSSLSCPPGANGRIDSILYTRTSQMLMYILIAWESWENTDYGQVALGRGPEILNFSYSWVSKWYCFFWSGDHILSSEYLYDNPIGRRELILDEYWLEKGCQEINCSGLAQCFRLLHFHTLEMERWTIAKKVLEWPLSHSCGQGHLVFISVSLSLSLEKKK